MSATPTLPLLGDPFESTGGAGCLDPANFCVSSGTLTLTSVVSSVFGTNQEIVADATYTATLTTLGNVPIGPLTLTGSLGEEVLGRTTSTETGSWTTDIVSLLLSGPALGNTLTVTLDGADTSAGTTSIASLGGDNGYSISSFFDVFADISLSLQPPLQTTLGPIELTATPAPEPAGVAVLAAGMLLLGVGRWRLRNGPGCVAGESVSAPIGITPR